MSRSALFVLLILVSAFAFGEGEYGANQPSPTPSQPLAESRPKADPMIGLGWSAIQARLRADHDKGVKLLPEVADGLYDVVEKNVSADSLATLSLLFELYPSAAPELLRRKEPNRIIFDCAFITWVRTTKPPVEKNAFADMLRLFLYVQKDDAPMADLIRSIFRGRENPNPVEEVERVRKMRILAIAFAYFPDHISWGILKLDVIAVLNATAHDPIEKPENQFLAAESARAMRRLLAPSKETSVADILETFAASRWDGRKEGDRTAEGTIVELTPGTRWIAVQYNPPGLVRCEIGCLTVGPILVESDSKLAFFTLTPSSDPNANPRPKFSIGHPGGPGTPSRRPTPAVVEKMLNLPDAGNVIESPPNDIGGISVLPVTHGLNVPKLTGGIFDLAAVPPPQKFKRSKILTDEDKERMRFATVVMSKDGPPEVELAFPLLTYARTFDEALRPSGVLAERERHETIEVAGFRSLSRLQLLYDTANQHRVSKDPITEARSAFLRQAVPVAALELSRRYIPDLEQQALQVSTTLAKVRETHRLVSNGRKSFSELSSESAFVLLGYAADSLAIEKPNVINDKQRLENALTGAEEQLRNLVLELSERKNFVCELLKKFEFPGTRLLPSMKVDEKVSKVCAEK